MSTDLKAVHLGKKEDKNCNILEKDARNLSCHHYCFFCLGSVTLLTLKEHFHPSGSSVAGIPVASLSTASVISGMMQNVLLLLAQFPLHFFV